MPNTNSSSNLFVKILGSAVFAAVIAVCALVWTVGNDVGQNVIENDKLEKQATQIALSNYEVNLLETQVAIDEKVKESGYYTPNPTENIEVNLTVTALAAQSIEVEAKGQAINATQTALAIDTPVPANPISYGNLIYQEDFDDTQHDWDLVGNRVENGSLVIGPTSDAVSSEGLAEPRLFSDFIYESRFMYPEGSRGIEFYLRQQYPPCQNWNCSITVVIDLPVNNVAAYKWENGNHGQPIALKPINPQQFKISPNQWNKMTIVVDGPKFDVYINDLFVMSFEDNTYQTGILIINNPGAKEIKVDYVHVYDLP